MGIIQNTMNANEIKYLEAKKRVKRIKGFYTHATIFVLVNIMVFIVNAREIPAGESLFQWRTLSTPFFWGIGLLAHGLSVFLPNFILGKNWEERKIKEFMDEEKRKFQ